MSEEEFIFNAITEDNVNAFDLNVIANTLASTDKLVRLNKQQQEENERLREKISSLRESALQIKSLYEAEVAKTGRIDAQLASYVSQNRELEQRCVEAENERVNTDLLLKERIAEFDRQIKTMEARYRGIVGDLVRYFRAHQQQAQSDAETDDHKVKWKDLRIHAGTAEMLDLPEDVRAFFQHSHPPGQAASRTKRKKRPDMCDHECQTMEAPNAVRMRTSATNTDEPHSARSDSPVEKKTFSDKGTMHSTMSTITRSTCTSAFIKRVDVGVNFPEVIHRSVDEILRECTRLPPLLLSPIMEFEPESPTFSQQSVETQTDFCQSPEPAAPILVPATQVDKPQLVSCGTITSLKNIRKRIDYRKADGGRVGGGMGVASFQQQYITIAEQLYAKKIKKEEQMSAPPVGFPETGDTFGRMHPHLSTIWTLLGETIFSLMGSPGRRFDGHCYSMINEQLATIRDMIEADGRRESELMSAMFSNVSATVEAAAGYGKERCARFPVRLSRVVPTEQEELPSAPQSPAGCFSPEEVLSPPPTSVPYPTQTKDTSMAVSGSASVTSTIISPQIEPTVNTDVQMEKQTEADEARSKDTVDGIGAVPGDSTAVDTERTERPTTSSVNSNNNIDSVLVDEENDRIAQELRLMEEGEDEARANSPALGTLSETPSPMVLASIEDILEGPRTASPVEEHESGTTVERIDISGPRLVEESIVPPQQRPSTPPNRLETNSSSSSTGTFVSPIKVKETNDLVKDQFKTPTQPPISKRKLRIRRSDEPHSSFSPKRQRFCDANSTSLPADQSETSGRLSPTTEFLLEDDWDQKFSSMKFTLFGHANEGTCRPLSPIADRFEEVDFDVVEPFPSAPQEEKEVCTVEKKKAEEIAPAERLEERTLVEKEPLEIVPPVGCERIGNSDYSSGEDEGRLTIDGLTPMEEDSVADESHQPVDSGAEEKNALGMECPADPVETVSTKDAVKCEARMEQAVSSDSKLPVEHAKESVHEQSVVEEEDALCIEAAMVDGNEDGEIVDNEGEEEQESAKTSETEPIVDAIVHLESPESPDTDSPMSPPAHETGGSVTTSEAVYSFDDSPLSPPPASPVDISTCAPPVLIPLDHVYLHRHRQGMRGPLDLAIECYKLERRFEVVNTHSGRLNPQELRSLKQLAAVLQRYVKSPWTDTSVAETLVQVLAISQDGRTIARAVLETVVSHGDIVVNLESSPPAPPIPVTQQKLVLLVRHLSPSLTTEPMFDRVMMRELDRRVFQLKAEATVSVPGLIALTFLYIGLEDSKPPTLAPWHRTYSVRLYLFKCLYYFGYKCLPLVYYVLRAFPFALPKKCSPNYDNADAMISTIRTILMNINYSESSNAGVPDSGLYKKRELFGLLTYGYGYQPGSPTYEELVVNLVEKIRANRLRNVPHALVLVAKRKSYDWARQHIIQKRLYPLLNDYLKLLDLMTSGGMPSFPTATPSSSSSSSSSSTASTHGCDLAGLDERIVACIYTISSIMKTHPANEDVSGVMQIFTTIVQLARGHQAIQEEAIAGLVKFSRFGQADIFERISHWQPTYPVSDRIKLMLATLLHRKDLRFWKQLMQNRIVDIDEKLLKQCQNAVKPLLVDYVVPSAKPLTVEIWRGNIAVSHECLEGTDAVIGIEIIEHLHQPVLDKVPETVFGFIRPKVAFFSTPNAEYNVLFDGLLENGFRHDDHKFEWTRAQFEEWASSICERYPDYCVKYFGIGPAPPGSEALGCVSQLAVFVRKDFLDSLPEPAPSSPPIVLPEQPRGESSKAKFSCDPNTREIIGPPLEKEEREEQDVPPVPRDFRVHHDGAMDEGRWVEEDVLLDTDSDDHEELEGLEAVGDDVYYGGIDVPEELRRTLRARNDSGNFEQEEEDAHQDDDEYWLIQREEYPLAQPDERTPEQRMRDEALYQLRRLRSFGEDYYHPEQDQYLIPLSTLHSSMGTEQATMEQLRSILTAERYRISPDDMICLPMEYSSDSDDDDDAVDDFAEYDVDDRLEDRWEEGDPNARPNRAVEGVRLADDDAMWD